MEVYQAEDRQTDTAEYGRIESLCTRRFERVTKAAGNHPIILQTSRLPIRGNMTTSYQLLVSTETRN